ncbi:hypothetical protein NOG11_14770, partial [Parvularcula sp. BGMRC 0090]|nr:hypothetical protein [Parvularcula maris]
MLGLSGTHAQNLEISPDGGTNSEYTYDAQTHAPGYGSNTVGSVDAATGSVGGTLTLLTIGDPSSGGLVYSRDVSDRDGRRDSFFSAVEENSTDVVVHALGAAYAFDKSGSSFNPARPHGATLTKSGSTWTLIDRAGSVYTFNASLGAERPIFAPGGRLSSVTYPDGTVLSFTYDTRELCDTVTNCASGDRKKSVRLLSVDSSLGYQIKYTYSATLTNGAIDNGNHTRITKVTAINKAIEACNPSVNGCSLSQNWQDVTFQYGHSNNDGRWTRIIDELGQETFYDYERRNGELLLHRVKLPGTSSGYDVTYTYWSDGRVRFVAGDPGDWEYNYASSAGVRTTSIKDPAGKTWTVKARESDNQTTEESNPLGHTTRYFYNSNDQLTEVRAPEGNRIVYTYDSRGNVLTTSRRSKAGDLPLTRSYTYPSCTSSNRKVCNQPSTITNHLGVTTTFGYSVAHGGTESVSSPIAGTATTAFIQSTASYKDYTGASRSAAVWRANYSDSPTGARTQFYYAGNRGATLSQIRITGSGVQTATSSVWYDRFGNVERSLSPTGADVRISYDMLRRPVVQIGPRPTGSSLQYLASKAIYDTDGRVSSVQQGRTSSPTSFGSFVALETQTNLFDSRGRLSRQFFNGGSATVSAVDYAYDAVGRVTCSGFRMSALTTIRSACTASSGSDGQDRVTYRQYDDAGRVTAVTSGYGTTAARTESFGYNNNGTAAWVSDGRGNRTTYEYDGHDRLVKTRYPVASNGASSSTTDYDQYTFNSLGQMTAHRKRDGQTIGYQYDGYGRMKTLDAPGTAVDVAMTYDAYSRLKTMASGGRTLTYGYDVLSRLKTEAGPLGTTGFHYDAAGRQTRIDYPGSDGFYATYHYDELGAVTEIKEKGSTNLATYSYDQLGRRKSLIRGNGVISTYGFDGASRLSDLDFTVPSATAYNMLADFQYNAAGQIERESHGNAAYADMPRTDELSFEVDDLNRYTKINAAQSVSYDGRGNLLSAGQGESYQYDVLNRLTRVTTSSGNVDLAYGPGGRLYEERLWNGAVTRFAYAGQALISEHHSTGGVKRRYVHGPGSDEALVWYE